MLRRLEEMLGYELVAPDGIVGTLHDVFLDDETWTVRYFAVDTGLWLGRLVLVSPISIECARLAGAEDSSQRDARRRSKAVPICSAARASRAKKSASSPRTTGIRSIGAARTCGAGPSGPVR